jgi:hypothetical protein
MKIAVIGAGSSGLITLKYLLDTYLARDIVCFEKSQSIRGCWGNQRPDFVSTSTKYTTQFSCFRKWQADVSPSRNFEEFYRGSEFGDYLEEFADHFKLKQCIRFGVILNKLERSQDKWQLRLMQDGQETVQLFDAVFLCTGLVNERVPLESTTVPIADNPETIRNSTVVIVGGGESASDIANYLAKPEHNNKVFLSLRSGIRVSPRYHPIRGVPSDFLRNRLLLSFDKKLRNRIGEKFVSFRIRFEHVLSRFFPSQKKHLKTSRDLRKEWDMKLKSRAKGQLFNVFHNKSDDFLDAVAEERLTIIGSPKDNAWQEFFDFDQNNTLHIFPEILVPSTGYKSRLPELSNGKIQLRDFYQGCVHMYEKNLFLIGFARPIIGNIPSITEIQVRYTVGLLAEKLKLPLDVNAKHALNRQMLAREYPSLNIENVYPVEQFPYCDELAREMNTFPSFAKCDLATWLKIMLTPASTTHYFDNDFDSATLKKQKVYMPEIIVGILWVFYLFLMPWQYIKRFINPTKE